MFARLVLGGLMALALGAAGTSQDKKKDEPRKGTVTGTLTAKGTNFIEVKADGEDKARKYFTGKDQEVLKVVKMAEIDSRVSLEWRFGEGFRVVKLELLKKTGKKDADDKKDEARRGTVTGVVSAKGPNWIEVTADGEEKGRRYVPHWRGGAPADGGGPDKEMVASIKHTPLKSRVRIEWEFEERARVIKIEVLKKADTRGDDAPAKETRSGTISGEIKSKKEQNHNIVIEVLAPGEEKARSYFVQYDPKLKAPIPEVLKAVAAASVGDRVVFDWEATGHGPAIVKFKVAGKGAEKK